MAASETTGDSNAAHEAATGDRAPLWIHLARDVGIALALLSLFAAADTWRILTETFLAGALSVVNGLVVGFGLASLAHEWGHYAGARSAGAVVPLKGASALGQIYDFDYQRNTPEQFDRMSIMGNVGNVLVVLLLAFGLPLATTGQVALLAGAVGSAVFASSIELPVIRKARAGMPPAEALATIPKDFLKRNGGAGLAAALLVLLIL